MMADPKTRYSSGLATELYNGDSGPQRKEGAQCEPALSMDNGHAEEQIPAEVGGVTWDGELDNDNPLNWPSGKKW